MIIVYNILKMLALAICICAFFLATYQCLIKSKLHYLGLCMIFIFSSASFAILWNVDSIKEISASFGKNKLDVNMKEIKRIERDIYAKAETVKKATELIADISAFNVSTIGRFAPKDLDNKMVETRDKLNVVLKEVGSDKAKIDRINSTINRQILFDLKNNVLDDVAKMSTNKRADKTIVKENVKKLLDNYSTSTKNDVKNYLLQQKIYDPAIDPSLEKLDKFQNSKTL